MLAFTNFQQGVSVKLHCGEVIKKRDVVWLTFLALKLLTGQCESMLSGEFINRVTNDYTEMLHSHFVNTPVYWGYQLNHINLKFAAQDQWFFLAA